MIAIPLVGVLNGEVQFLQRLIGTYLNLTPHPAGAGQAHVECVGFHLVVLGRILYGDHSSVGLGADETA